LTGFVGACSSDSSAKISVRKEEICHTKTLPKIRKIIMEERAL